MTEQTWMVEDFSGKLSGDIPSQYVVRSVDEPGDFFIVVGKGASQRLRQRLNLLSRVQTERDADLAWIEKLETLVGGQQAMIQKGSEARANLLNRAGFFAAKAGLAEGKVNGLLDSWSALQAENTRLREALEAAKATLALTDSHNQVLERKLYRIWPTDGEGVNGETWEQAFAQAQARAAAMGELLEYTSGTVARIKMGIVGPAGGLQREWAPDWLARYAALPQAPETPRHE